MQDARPIVLVYQMGKVGSKSISDALEAVGAFRVVHLHWLNPVTVEKVNGLYKDKGFKSPPYVDTAKAINVRLDVERETFLSEIVCILSLVREPVARNISAFFQNLIVNYPAGDYSDILDMIEKFFSNYMHNIPERWFDQEIKHVFDIDV